MKIALCGRFNTDVKHQGGSAEVLLTLAEKLSKNHQVVIFGRGKPTEAIIAMCRKNAIRFHYIPSDTILNIFLGPLRALVLLKRNFDGFDIIHTHNGSFAFASLFFKKKSKIITHIHEIAVLKENPFRVKIYLLLENFLVRIASRKSHLVIVHSEYMKGLVMSAWKIKNVTSIKIGVDVSIFQYKKNGESAELFNAAPIKLLFVGRLTKRKGILELVESMDYLKNSNAMLCIVGVGELYDEISARIPKMNVKIISPIKNVELPYFYSAADLVIVPSYYEPTGLVPLESLACGTPVLVSYNTGLKEIGPAFFIDKVEPRCIAENISKTLASTKLSKDEYRRYILDNHDWDKLVGEYLSAYEKLLEKKASHE